MNERVQEKDCYYLWKDWNRFVLGVVHLLSR